MIDVTETISAVRRAVSGRTLEAGEARVVTLSRSYPAGLAARAAAGRTTAFYTGAPK